MQSDQEWVKYPEHLLLQNYLEQSSFAAVTRFAGGLRYPNGSLRERPIRIGRPAGAHESQVDPVVATPNGQCPEIVGRGGRDTCREMDGPGGATVGGWAPAYLLRQRWGQPVWEPAGGR